VAVCEAPHWLQVAVYTLAYLLSQVIIYINVLLLASSNSSQYTLQIIGHFRDVLPSNHFTA